MNKRNILIVLACLIIFLVWYSFQSSHKTETTPAVLKTEEKPVKVAKPKPLPVKVVPAKKDVVEDIKSIRSRQKLHLASIYTALKAMHADFKRYSTDLHYMGYRPDTEIDLKIGFIKPYYPADLETSENSYEDPERMTNVLSADDPAVTITDLADAIDLSDYEHLCKKGCTATDKEFEIMVVSPLQNGKHDVWVINEKKEIVQVLDGTR